MLNTIKQTVLDSGLFECGEVKIGDIIFHEDIRRICEDNACGGYGRTWACPPAVGTVGECRERCLSYDHMALFSGKYDLEDSFDFQGMKMGMLMFKGAVDRLDESIKSYLTDYRILSNEGCIRCARCSYPDSSCRFPGQLFHSIEGYGLVVGELAGLAGIHYNNGPGTVTFFGAVLWRDL